jgi:NhaP-type Na+/H+ or K+/H+ antiporter
LLFPAILAVSSTLKTGGAPEILGALLEGESLFNDASGLLMFDVFLRFLRNAEDNRPSPNLAEQLLGGAGAASGGGGGLVGRRSHRDQSSWEQVRRL